MLKRVLSVQAE